MWYSGSLVAPGGVVLSSRDSVLFLFWCGRNVVSGRFWCTVTHNTLLCLCMLLSFKPFYTLSGCWCFSPYASCMCEGLGCCYCCCCTLLYTVVCLFFYID